MNTTTSKSPIKQFDDCLTRAWETMKDEEKFNGQIKILHHDEEFTEAYIKSSSRDIVHHVMIDSENYYCSCEDHQFRKNRCKHIRLVENHFRRV